MNRKQFVRKLKRLLKGLPRDEMDSALQFYDESVRERMAQGVGEEEAVEALGLPETAAAGIISGLSNDDRARFEKKRRFSRLLSIPSILIGIPVWISLLAVGFSAALALAVVWLALIIVLAALALTFAVCVPVFAAQAFIGGEAYCLMIWIGAGLICAGLAPMFGWTGYGAARLFAGLVRRILAGKHRRTVAV